MKKRTIEDTINMTEYEWDEADFEPADHDFMVWQLANIKLETIVDPKAKAGYEKFLKANK